MARGGRRFKRGHPRRGPAQSTADATPPVEPVEAAASPAAVPAPINNAPLARGQFEPAAGAGRNGPLVRDVSAGGVVYRRPETHGDVEIALVGRLRPRRWALPKGTPEAGETLERTAVREVSEETGLLARIEQPLEHIQYWFVWGGVRHFKTVHFYLMQMTGGDTADHDAEYDIVEWFPIAEALQRLSYPNEARVVERALQALNGPAA